MWGELAPPTAPQERLCHGRWQTMSLGLWVQGARPRTLVAAVCPVLVGTAAAAAAGPLVAWRAAAALVVAVALQVGVNYANDYSDGLRGTNTPARPGPARRAAPRPRARAAA